MTIMNKVAALVAGLALVALSVGCATDTGNTNANSNVAIVTNTNANTNVNANANANANTNANRYNANITREEYEKQKESYEGEARELGSKVGQGATDGWLWVKTRAALLAAEDLRDSTINVDVENSVVTLRGSVASNAQKTRAEQVAKGVEGVKSIRNQLTVSAAGDNRNMNANANANKKS